MNKMVEQAGRQAHCCGCGLWRRPGSDRLLWLLRLQQQSSTTQASGPCLRVHTHASAGTARQTSYCLGVLGAVNTNSRRVRPSGIETRMRDLSRAPYSIRQKQHDTAPAPIETTCRPPPPSYPLFDRLPNANMPRHGPCRGHTHALHIFPLTSVLPTTLPHARSATAYSSLLLLRLGLRRVGPILPLPRAVHVPPLDVVLVPQLPAVCRSQWHAKALAARSTPEQERACGARTRMHAHVCVRACVRVRVRAYVVCLLSGVVGRAVHIS